MPQYKLKLLNDAGESLGEIECFATNPWLALEKSSKTIGRNMVEVYDGERTFGRFRTAFPMTQVWEVSPALRRETKAWARNRSFEFVRHRSNLELGRYLPIRQGGPV